MFKEKTVFIVGAGASAEVGLPVGTSLAAKIASMLRFKFEPIHNTRLHGDEHIHNTLKLSPADYKAHIHAAQRIAEGIELSESIDNYLFNHAHDEQIKFCGKLAIARAILQAEHKSWFYYEKTNRDSFLNFDRTKDTWFRKFSDILINGISKSQISEIFKNISIICFNYDRCIEYYLIHALQRAYAISESEAHELVSTLNIHRPYGSLGGLPSTENPNGIAFGEEASGNKLIQIAKSIRTYTEQIDDMAALQAIKDAVAEANILTFLGFAYHDQNLELLRIENAATHHQTILGTALEVSDFNQEKIKQKVFALNNHMVTSDRGIQPITCAKLLIDYRQRF